MRSKESIKEIMDYLQAGETEQLQFNEEGISLAYQKSSDDQSLAIKILSIFGGILACIAFLAFLFISGMFDSEKGLIVFGLFCIAGAIWLNKNDHKIIVDTVSVAFYLIGFALLGIGLDKLKFSGDVISIVFIILSVLALSIVQAYILSFISVLIINGAIFTLIISDNNYDLFHFYVSALSLVMTYFFLREAKFIKHSLAFSKLYNPARLGLIFSFLSALYILGKRGVLPMSTDYIWISSVFIIGIIIYLLSRVFEILNVTKKQDRISIYSISVLLLILTALSPAISGSLLIILLSFLVNYKTGFIIGVIAFIYFVSQFYYDLNLTLLTKSILLFGSGVLFIVLYLFTHQKLTGHEKV